MPRTILLVASWYPGERAPTRGSFVREQAIALSKRGYDVHVASFDRDGRRRPFKWEERRDPAGIVEHALGAAWPLHRLVGFYWPRLFAARLDSLIDELRPTLIHAHAVRPAGVVTSRAAATSRIPFVLTEHSGPLTAFWWTKHGRRQIAHAFEACDVRIAVSSSLRADIEQLFPRSGPWEVIPNGIDIAAIEPKARPTFSRDLLFVGGLEPVKDIATILRSLARLDEGVSLTIVGRGPEEPRLRKLAGELNLESRIRWLGAQSRQQVFEQMRRHAALIVASRVETFSLVAAEALACGTPVVATRCGGPEEIVPAFGGKLVPVGDDVAMAAAISHVLSHAHEFDPQTLWDHVEKRFSFARVSETLEAVYERAMGEKSGKCAE